MVKNGRSGLVLMIVLASILVSIPIPVDARKQVKYSGTDKKGDIDSAGCKACMRMVMAIDKVIIPEFRAKMVGRALGPDIRDATAFVFPTYKQCDRLFVLPVLVLVLGLVHGQLDVDIDATGSGCLHLSERKGRETILHRLIIGSFGRRAIKHLQIRCCNRST